MQQIFAFLTTLDLRQETCISFADDLLIVVWSFIAAYDVIDPSHITIWSHFDHRLDATSFFVNDCLKAWILIRLILDFVVSLTVCLLVNIFDIMTFVVVVIIIITIAII